MVARLLVSLIETEQRVSIPIIRSQGITGAAAEIERAHVIGSVTSKYLPIEFIKATGFEGITANHPSEVIGSAVLDVGSIDGAENPEPRLLNDAGFTTAPPLNVILGK